MKVTVRSLSGNAEVELEGDNITVAQIREAAGIASGFTLRHNGASCSDDEPVEDGGAYVATPPEVKHG